MAELPLGAALAGRLGEVDLSVLNDSDTLTVIESAKRTAAWAESVALRASAHFADLRHTLEPATARERRAGQEQAKVMGGPGTPSVDEFAAAELAPVLKISAAAARIWICDCLDLRHRLPRIAGLVAAGRIEVFRARIVAQHTRRLSLEDARVVEVPVIGRVETLPPSWLRRVVDEEAIAIDPLGAEADRQDQREDQRVVIDILPGGVGELWGRADNDALLRLEQRLNTVAGWLAELGDTDTVQQRRDTDGNPRWDLEGHGPITEQWARVSSAVHRSLSAPSLTWPICRSAPATGPATRCAKAPR